MSLRYETLHGDIKESLRRSQEFQMGLETIFSKVNGGNFSTKAKKTMQSRQQAIDKTEAVLAKSWKPERPVAKDRDTPPKPRKAPTASTSTESSPKNLAPKRGRFRSQIREFNHKLALIKTGKVHPDFSEESNISRILETSPTVRTNNSTVASHHSFDFSDPRALPHVSCVSGKLEQPMTLPSYEEYCKTHQLGAMKGSTLQPFLKKLEDRIGGLERMKRRLQGLDILLASRERWDGDIELLEKLERHPEQKGAILSARHTDEQVGGKFNPRKTMVLRKSCPRAGATRLLTHEDAERLVAACAERFEASKATQEQQLDDIVQRMTIEKPFQFRQKAQLFKTERLSVAHSTQVFFDLRRNIESARGERVRQSRAQAQIYRELLLFTQSLDFPTDSQLQCLSVVRRFLEEGWVLTPEVCDQVQQALGSADESVRALLAVARKFLT